MQITQMLGTRAWLAIPYFESHLYDELNSFVKNELEWEAEHSIKTYGKFLSVENIPTTKLQTNIFWKQLEIIDPFIAEFSSIKDAVKLLKNVQRNWVHSPYKHIRRGELIQNELPYINRKPKQFPLNIPTSPLGVFTLLDEHHLFASNTTSSPFPLGEAHFIEDKINPPSRAYLKLYEALTLMDYYKRKQDGDDAGLFNQKNGHLGIEKPFLHLHCIDAGASPGGWTWVLDLLGANITAIDRSSLVPSLMIKKNINFIPHDAFTLPLQSFNKVDWVFSDVICYPPRLLEWVNKWLKAELCNNFICTIKMQGTPDISTINEFAQIPHSRIVHLFHNKHELTWFHANFL